MNVLRPTDRIFEVKSRVEALKTKVRTLLEQVSDAKVVLESKWPRSKHDFQTHARAKAALRVAQNELANAKLELTKLSGTTGGDPRWKLLRETWHVLNELEERGVELGDRAEALLEEIEFHVPAAALQAHSDSPHMKGRTT